MRRLWRWVVRGVVSLVVLVLLYVGLSVIQVQRHEQADPMVSAPAGGRFTDVDGIAVFSQAHGKPEAPPLLLVHGTAAWSGTWFSLIPALEGAGYRVIAVDLPPFGYSGKSVTADFSRDAQAKRLAAVLDAHGVERATVIGHSFGGGPALELALAKPERVQRLVLVDAALGWDSEPKPKSPVCLLLATSTPRHVLLAATATNPLWSKTLLRSFVARKEAVTDERLAFYRAPSQSRGATNALGAWSHHFVCDTERGLSTDPAQISRLQAPLTLIWGADDSITPLDQAHRLRKLLPQADLQVIPGVGHIPHIEAPQAFEGVLLRDLREAQGASAANTEAPSA